MLISCDKEPSIIENIEGNYKVESNRDVDGGNINIVYGCKIIRDNSGYHIENFNFMFKYIELDLIFIDNFIYIDKTIKSTKIIHNITGKGYILNENLMFDFNIDYGDYFYHDLFIKK